MSLHHQEEDLALESPVTTDLLVDIEELLKAKKYNKITEI